MPALPNMLTEEQMNEFRSVTHSAIVKQRQQSPEAEYNKSVQEDNTNILDKASNLINEEITKFQNLPVIKQAGQAVGAAIGQLGSLLGSGIAGIATPISNIAQGKPVFQDFAKNVNQTAEDTKRFGKDIGFQATTTAPLGALGKVAQVPLAAAQLYGGGKEVVQGLKEGDAAKTFQGALTAGSGLVGGIAGVKGKGAILNKEITTPLRETITNKVPATQKLFVPIEKASQFFDKNAQIKATVDKRYQALSQVVDNNGALRKIVADAQSKGIDVKRLLSQTDLLVDSIDSNGTIRTTEPGGAVSQMQDFLSHGENGGVAPEAVISNLLEKEGKFANLADLEKQMMDNLKNSDIVGADKKRAMNKIQDEIDGLKLEADENGNIPLSLVNDAKAYKYKNIDYNSPSSQNTDKLIARSMKELVENNTTSADVKTLNKELSSHYAVLSLLEKLDGRKVAGGKLGLYFAKGVGAIAGSHFGPLGVYVGSEVASKLKSLMMSGSFGKKTGGQLKSSETMLKATKK